MNKFSNKLHKLNFGDAVSCLGFSGTWVIRAKVTTTYVDERGDVVHDASYRIRSLDEQDTINDAKELELTLIEG